MGLYYCKKCNQNHQTVSGIGKKHRKYKGKPKTTLTKKREWGGGWHDKRWEQQMKEDERKEKEFEKRERIMRKQMRS